MVLAREMPVAAMAALLGEHETRLWRVIHHYVEQARAQHDDSAVRQVGMDETASRRGHQSVSLFVDLERAKVLFATGRHRRPAPSRPSRPTCRPNEATLRR